jgi:hypothetical protein
MSNIPFHLTAAGEGIEVSQQNLHTFNMIAVEEGKKHESHCINEMMNEHNNNYNNDDTGKDDLDNSRK